MVEYSPPAIHTNTVRSNYRKDVRAMPLILDCTLSYSAETNVRLNYRSQQDDFVMLGMTKGKVSAEMWHRAQADPNLRRSIRIGGRNARLFADLLESAYRQPAHRMGASEEKEIQNWLALNINVYIHPFRKDDFVGAEVRFYWTESDGAWIWKDSIKSVAVSYER